jgi:AbrB family looped-hinge helix DNA binding protein
MKNLEYNALSGKKGKNVMLQSIVTSKGQTTIPKRIRDLLNIKPNDRIFYLVEGGKVILKPIHGDILELRGSVPTPVRPADFNAIRVATRKKIAGKIVENE